MTQQANISISFFLWFCKKNLICIVFFAIFVCFFIWVITFKPIRIQTCSTTQNDCLNLIFVKKWLEMVVKWPFVIILFMHQSLSLLFHSLLWHDTPAKMISDKNRKKELPVEMGLIGFAIYIAGKSQMHGSYKFLYFSFLGIRSIIRCEPISNLFFLQMIFWNKIPKTDHSELCSNNWSNFRFRTANF